MKNRILLFGLSVALLFVLSGCVKDTAETAIEPKCKSYFSFFDTVSYVYSYSGDSAERFENCSADVSAILKEYHCLFDIYHEYSGINNLCTVNRLAGGDPVEVDRKLIDFMLYARELYELTNGEMNIMMGAVLSLWHECRSEAVNNSANARIPDINDLKRAAEHIDFSLLEIDQSNNTLRITDPKASIDVGALGKGYATERAAEMLEKENALGYVLNIGGNIRVIGTKPNGTGWRTGIRDPITDGALAAYIRLSDTSCVTSGIYERFFTVDSVRYHHIIDKDTLFPSEYYASVTIVTHNSALADAMSTALFCMPYEEGFNLVNSMDGVEVLWILPNGEQLCTSGFEKLLEE